MSEQEVQSWGARFQEALGSIAEQKRRKAGFPNQIDSLMDEAEQGLFLQGATANEDKLQVGVPETLATLARAGIRTWMLTGDKEETAVNIGFATRLIRPGMRVVRASTLNHTALQGARAVVALAREQSRIPEGRDSTLLGTALANSDDATSPAPFDPDSLHLADFSHRH